MLSEIFQNDRTWLPAPALAAQFGSPAVYVKQCCTKKEITYNNQKLYHAQVQITAVQTQQGVLMICVCIDPRARFYGLVMKRQMCKDSIDIQRFLNRF